MLRVAVPAVGIAWCLQYFDARALLAVPAPAWAAGALLAWCLLGGRAALLVLSAGWTLLRADALIGQRLPEAMAGRDVLVRGTVCDFVRTDPAATRFVLDHEAEPDGASWPGRLHLSWYENAPQIRPGERWQLRVRLKPPRGLANPAGFDFEHWLYLRQIGATGQVRDSRLNARLPPGPRRCAVAGLRSRIASRIEASLGGHAAAGHVLGVAVGATHRLAEADWDLLRRTGTTHLLAISGLNIAMVAAPFLFAGPLLGRIWGAAAGRPHLGLLPALLAAAGYSTLSGFAISTVRALAMLCVAAALTLCRRRVEGVELLGAAAIGVVILDPAAVTSVSFWLSFVAVAWLFVAATARERPRPGATQSGHGAWHAARRATLDLGRAQIVLGLGLAPLTLAWFRELSLVAPLTNLVAVPVFSCVIMPLTLLGTALVMVAPGAGAMLLGLAASATQMLLGFLGIFAAAPAAVWRPPWSSAAGLVAATLGAALLCWWRPVPLRALALAWLLPALAGTRLERPELRVTVMDVGQGLAVLVETARHALLYDAGPAFRMRDAGESVVLPVLRAAGVRDLHAVVISHDDQDHRGGAGTVLRAFPRAQLIAPALSGLEAGRFLPCAAGHSWRWDGVRFRVISPDPSGGWRPDNDGSCVLRVEIGRASLLLPGDIERAREERLAAGGQLAPAGLVLAPHHGSRSSSSPAFVAALRPRYLVVSAGHRNRWGFPAPEVVRRWEGGGACIVGTAESGAIVFAAGADGWEVRHRERLDGAHLWTAREHSPGACDGAPDR